MIKQTTKIIYACDLCKKEVRAEENLRKLTLPCHYYDLEHYMHHKTDDIVVWSGDVCKDCCNKIINSLESFIEIGMYAYQGFNVELKEENK